LEHDQDPPRVDQKRKPGKGKKELGFKKSTAEWRQTEKGKREGVGRRKRKVAEGGGPKGKKKRGVLRERPLLGKKKKKKGGRPREKRERDLWGERKVPRERKNRF